MTAPPADCFVYALYERHSVGTPRYVGKTERGAARIAEHARDRRHTHKTCWLRSLERRGKSFGVIILERCWPEQLSERERYWIRWCRERGFRLTNATDGGEGTCGWQPSDEVRARMSASHIGHPPTRGNTGMKHTSTTKERISRSLRGRVFTPETLAKMSQSHRALMQDLEARARLSRKGVRLSTEHKRKISEALRRRDSPSEITRMRLSLSQSGELNNRAILTASDVRKIRAMASSGIATAQLTELFGVSAGQIRAIVKRRSWKSIE